MFGGTALLFPPAYSHMPKDYYSITTALLQYRENMQTSEKSTPLYYLLAVKEEIHVGPWIENMSTLSTSCLKASIITNCQTKR